MTHSDSALKLITEFEGCRLTSYRDGNDVWTVGYGHTPAVQGQTISEDDALLLLSEDLKVAEEAINRLVWVPLTQNQFDALCSFVFNVGQGNFAVSTMRKCLNRSEMAQAASEFMRWVHIGSEVSQGLVRRRNAEKELFQGGSPGNA